MFATDRFLEGVRIAVMISDGFEERALDQPVLALNKVGASVDILGMVQDQMARGIQGMNHLEIARKVKPCGLVNMADPVDYQGLLIPGGLFSADGMRMSRTHLAFVKNFMDEDKPVGVTGQSCWLLADSGTARGRTLTSWPAICKDLERAGAIWKDQPVIVDHRLVTSRKLEDLDKFSLALIETLARYIGREVKEVA